MKVNVKDCPDALRQRGVRVMSTLAGGLSVLGIASAMGSSEEENRTTTEGQPRAGGASIESFKAAIMCWKGTEICR
jgi:hypothetical protein